MYTLSELQLFESGIVHRIIYTYTLDTLDERMISYLVSHATFQGRNIINCEANTFSLAIATSDKYQRFTNVFIILTIVVSMIESVLVNLFELTLAYFGYYFLCLELWLEEQAFIGMCL